MRKKYGKKALEITLIWIKKLITILNLLLILLSWLYSQRRDFSSHFSCHSILPSSTANPKALSQVLHPSLETVPRSSSLRDLVRQAIRTSRRSLCLRHRVSFLFHYYFFSLPMFSFRFIEIRYDFINFNNFRFCIVHIVYFML